MRISFFGIGYGGGVRCGCLAQLGHQVIGVDTAAGKPATLCKGRSPILGAEIGHTVAGAAATGSLSATADAAEAIART